VGAVGGGGIASGRQKDEERLLHQKNIHSLVFLVVRDKKWSHFTKFMDWTHDAPPYLK